MGKENKILVVVDMQNDFVDGALGSKEAVAIVPNVCEKIKNWDGVVFVTRDTHQHDYMNTMEGKKLPVLHCIEGSKGWDINSDIQKALNEKVVPVIVNKPTFGSTELVENIRAWMIMCGDYETDGENFDIEICGLVTSICVVSNTLLIKANFPNATISVDSSCCAGVTPEKHNAALATMDSCHINII